MDEWIVPAEKELDDEEVDYLRRNGARRLVRCKDCKYRNDKDTCPCCKSRRDIDDWFCADGKRRIDDV